MLIESLVLAAAVAADPMTLYRQKTRVERPCREAAARGEIVVCAKRGSVYRLPFRQTTPGSLMADKAEAYETRRRLHGRAVDIGGIGSCSAVGPGGMTGCTPGLTLVGLGRNAAPGVIGGLFKPVPIDD
jgi:hypothetical protein